VLFEQKLKSINNSNSRWFVGTMLFSVHDNW